MSNAIKISLTINLEGSTLVRKSDPEKIKYTILEKDINPLKKGKSGMKVVKEGETNHFPLVSKPATQHINLSEYSYKYMVSIECPYWAKPKVWKTMSAKERLKSHLQRVCENFNGKSYNYKVLDD